MAASTVAAMKVLRKPVAANTAPSSDVPVMNPSWRDRFCRPETVPLRPSGEAAITAVLLAAWNSA
jgi:hypothetical protein